MNLLPAHGRRGVDVISTEVAERCWLRELAQSRRHRGRADRSAAGLRAPGAGAASGHGARPDHHRCPALHVDDHAQRRRLFGLRCSACPGRRAARDAARRSRPAARRSPGHLAAGAARGARWHAARPAPALPDRRSARWWRSRRCASASTVSTPRFAPLANGASVPALGTLLKSLRLLALRERRASAQRSARRAARPTGCWRRWPIGTASPEAAPGSSTSRPTHTSCRAKSPREAMQALRRRWACAQAARLRQRVRARAQRDRRTTDACTLCTADRRAGTAASAGQCRATPRFGPACAGLQQVHGAATAPIDTSLTQRSAQCRRRAARPCALRATCPPPSEPRWCSRRPAAWRLSAATAAHTSPEACATSPTTPDASAAGRPHRTRRALRAARVHRPRRLHPTRKAQQGLTRCSNHLAKHVAAETARTGKRRTIHLTDDTLRDGQQCLWATRMRTEHMLPIAERMDRAGFLSMQAIALVQFDASVLFLNQDPFERIRLLRERITPHAAARRHRARQPDARLLPGGRRHHRAVRRAADRQRRPRDRLFRCTASARTTWRRASPRRKRLGADVTYLLGYNIAPGYDDAALRQQGARGRRALRRATVTLGRCGRHPDRSSGCARWCRRSRQAIGDAPGWSSTPTA